MPGTITRLLDRDTTIQDYTFEFETRFGLTVGDDARVAIRTAGENLAFVIDRDDPSGFQGADHRLLASGDGLSIDGDGNVIGMITDVTYAQRFGASEGWEPLWSFSGLSIDASEFAPLFRALDGGDEAARTAVYDALMSDVTTYRGTNRDELGIAPEPNVSVYNLRGGNDRMDVEIDAETTSGHFNGGRGQDHLWFDSSNGVLDIAAGTFETQIGDEQATFTFENFELISLDNGRSYRVLGSDGDDIASSAGTETNVLRGFGGNDTLRGYTGSDRLFGGSGRDSLEGGGKRDTLTGGTGADVFIFQGDTRTDTITDFNVNKDVVQIEASLIGDRDLADLLSDSARGLRLSWADNQGVILEGVTLAAFDLDSITLI